LVRFLLAELMIGTPSRLKILLIHSGFSLLLAELMIGTMLGPQVKTRQAAFQSPISGVNDWNLRLL